MYFEVLIKCAWDDETSYEHYYIVKAEDQKDAIIKAGDFISTYFINEEAGTLLTDRNNKTYKFSDDEIVEILSIKETTTEKFLEDHIGEMFLIK